MTPRRAALPALVCAAFLLAMAPVVAQGDATAPSDPASGAVDYAVVIFPKEAGGAFSWEIKELAFPAGADVQLTYDHGTAAAPHNLHVKGAVDKATTCCLSGEGGRESLAFTMPESGELTYVCDVHPEMLGKITVGTFSVGGAAAAGGEDAGIEHVGVHYLAYWVAVIAFAVLFIIYGLTFFLFKNGESNATTDHMDRPGAATGDASGNRLRTVTVVLVTIVIVAGGLVLAFLNMPAAG